ncbi:DNA polymerase III subunit delta [Methylosarcina fibrata]|uniref:DNA polymerase III subunit delta n=1 Tax=Methylosarcina fibrata TaxID=105972 RepID=UPI000369BC8F|nr:DNA polymerase III subunit delta [Methylosarcina fibrata]
MRLKPEQLDQHLKQGLAPVYLVSGDEPQQLGEACDAVRAAARKAGFETREIFSADAGFEWSNLTVYAGTLSIFSDKKVIDLRLPGTTPGADGSKALMAYCQHPPEDTLLLITMDKLTGETLKSHWFQAVDKTGVVVQVWPVDGQELIRWLQQRLQRRGLSAEAEGVRLLAAMVEGNLLAAVQEIEKLYILYGAGPLSARQILDVVADSSRFDVYKLIDSVLRADTHRTMKILSALQAEGIAAPIVLWALTREARTLSKIKQALAQGRNRETVYRNHQIRDNRKALISSALDRLSQADLDKILLRSARVDRQIKGQEPGDPWETLLSLCLSPASVGIVTEPDR